MTIRGQHYANWKTIRRTIRLEVFAWPTIIILILVILLHIQPEPEMMSRMLLSLVSGCCRLYVSIYNQTNWLTVWLLVLWLTHPGAAAAAALDWLLDLALSPPPDAEDAKRRREIKHLEIPNYSSPVVVAVVVGSKRLLPPHTKRCGNKGRRYSFTFPFIPQHYHRDQSRCWSQAENIYNAIRSTICFCFIFAKGTGSSCLTC